MATILWPNIYLQSHINMVSNIGCSVMLLHITFMVLRFTLPQNVIVLPRQTRLNGLFCGLQKSWIEEMLPVTISSHLMVLQWNWRKNRKKLPPLFLGMKGKLFRVCNHSLDSALASDVKKKRPFLVLLSTIHKKNQMNENDVQKKLKIIDSYNSTKFDVCIWVGTYPRKYKLNWCNMIDISELNAFVVFINLNPLRNHT